jgi:hypothetical protein
MVPEYSSGREQGQRMTEGGTAYGDECICCRRRFTHRYYIPDGPYCATCADRKSVMTDLTKMEAGR